MSKPEEGKVKVVCLNVGESVNATQEFLVRCAQADIAVTFMGECWVERNLRRGRQLYQNHVHFGCMSGAARVVCYIHRDPVDYCMLVECTNGLISVQLGGVRIEGVYCKCGTGVNKMLGILEFMHVAIGNERWVLIRDWNTHNVRWSIDGKSDT